MVKSAKKIVIIGIGNIGFSILKQLNNTNDTVEIIAIARRYPTYLEDYSSQINDNIKLTFIEADATDESKFQEIVNGENLNDINVLISTVGFSSQSYDFDEYQKDFNSNFYGNVIPIKALLNKIPIHSGSRIIIISSTSGNKAPKTVNSYAPSKFALETFSSALQQELIEDGIFVDIIRPTNIINEFSDVFKTNRGISANLVGARILKLIQLTLRGSQVSGKKIFVPYYFFGLRILERVFPNILNHIFGLNSKSKRRREYKKHFVNKVLITGGSSGLGLELAKIYAKHSGEVIITGRNGEKLVEAHNQLKKISNCKVITKQIDFISIHDLKDFLKEIGNVDLLINNAGQHLSRSIKETSINEYVEILNANFFSPLLLANHLIFNSNTRKVINILSTTAICGRKNHSAYSSSKSALWAYSRSLRRHKGNRIQVLEVIPSTFKSDLNRNARKKVNEAIVKSKNDLLESKEVAERVVKAEKSGKDILFIPFKSRLFLLLESLCYPIFRKMFLK
ncbi:SDR family NAD(P)-dependent oxidoreductase [Lutimonas vermicola]|uniref:SDR family NAD(P)-dependent oxidoreductase n=1 Tax=Lutimonas vermicola TaxID=414288 RepID=A0ABU9L440_9FLAO